MEKQAFVDSLIADRILPSGTSVDGFWEAFVPYMKQQGLRLVYGIQRLTFAMSSQHVSLRLSCCRQQQSAIATKTVRECWFTDEVTRSMGHTQQVSLAQKCKPQQVCLPACSQPCRPALLLMWACMSKGTSNQ